jgi:hypothetical protein
MDLDIAQRGKERDERLNRRQILLHIIDLILNGKIDSSKTPLAKIFNQMGPRQEYVSPKDRGGYNYGYTDTYNNTGEMPFTGDG